MAHIETQHDAADEAGVAQPLGGKVVVTGATGMLGGEVALQLARAGCKEIVLPVRNLARLAALKARMEAEGLDIRALRPMEVSLSCPDDMREALRGASALLHCAAMVDFGDRDNGMVAGNVGITSTLVDAALECKIGIMVHVSSIATLGEADPPGSPITERTPLQSLDGQPPYTVSKFLAEQQVRRGMEQGLRTVVVMPSVILGCGDWNGRGSSAIVKIIASGIPFYPAGMTGFVDVCDVARAMIALAGCEKAVGESFLLNGANAGFRELMSLAAEAAGKRPPRWKAGKGLLLGFRGFEKALSVFGYTPQLSRLAIEYAASTTRYDGSKIKRYIDFEYTSLRQTVRRVVKAYLDDKGCGDSGGRG